MVSDSITRRDGCLIYLLRDGKRLDFEIGSWSDSGGLGWGGGSSSLWSPFQFGPAPPCGDVERRTKGGYGGKGK
ncbi:hypothetical protein NC653_019204 [Populus alba x Populus x berolinensis]|uniref:Uncharacterized protein n=1 Tax=Populus alba x Populus x berolinensis TaxID=444605 RepID=A0AAD6QIC9_9ROSI|nr:hypothetical protein NC653_019204 [Populus alba x Populus x berolinensis]